MNSNCEITNLGFIVLFAFVASSALRLPLLFTTHDFTAMVVVETVKISVNENVFQKTSALCHNPAQGVPRPTTMFSR